MALHREYIDNFIESLSLTFECKNLARVLFLNVEDCHRFYKDYLGRNQYVIDDLIDFKEYKLMGIDVNVDDFIKLCETSFKNAFETVFLHFLTKEDEMFLIEKIGDNRMVLENIYHYLKDNPNENVIKYIKYVGV